VVARHLRVAYNNYNRQFCRCGSPTRVIRSKIGRFGEGVRMLWHLLWPWTCSPRGPTWSAISARAWEVSIACSG